MYRQRPRSNTPSDRTNAKSIPSPVLKPTNKPTSARPHHSSSKSSENVNSSSRQVAKSKPLMGSLDTKARHVSHRRANSQLGTRAEPVYMRRLSIDDYHALNTVSSYAHCSHAGYSTNSNKPNQDRYIECSTLGAYSMFGVCDGHGPEGHLVSQFIKDTLPKTLKNELILQTDQKKAIAIACKRVESDLQVQSFEVGFSGSTLVTVLIKDNKLWCANIGDSRAMLARLMKPPGLGSQNFKHWMAIALSRDHKPTIPEEKHRILQHGGRVECCKDEKGKDVGPARVWHQHERFPGLAMSRSLGDGISKQVGVVADPEIVEYTFSPDDKFIVIGSDGVFEFLTNEEIVKIVVKYWKNKDSEGAAMKISREARKLWIKNDSGIDDITCIVIFLQL